MKALVIDPFSGISGDMFLGAIISLGVSGKALEKAIKKGGVTGFNFDVRDVTLNGIQAKRLRVKNGEKMIFKNKREFRDFIKKLNLSLEILSKFKEGMEMVFETEKKIHGRAHIHEIGTLDTVVDIIGAIVGVEKLGVGKVYVLPVNTGSGFVKTSHNFLPCPAPLTLELLKGFYIYSEGKGELTTPTGALILHVLSAVPAEYHRFKVLEIGYGAGDYTHNPFPDILRLYLCEELPDEIIVVETNVDDMNPQLFSSIFDALFKAGAMDVFVSYGIMKKGRPGFMISVLCEKANMDRVIEAVFRNTTTLGVRFYPVSRVELHRRIEGVKTDYGMVRIKKGFFGKECTNISFEFSDIEKIATKTGKTPKEILKELHFKF